MTLAALVTDRKESGRPAPALFLDQNVEIELTHAMNRGDVSKIYKCKNSL